MSFAGLGEVVINFALTGCKIYTIKKVSSAPRWFKIQELEQVCIQGHYPITDGVSRTANPVDGVLAWAQSLWKAITSYSTGAQFHFYWNLPGDCILPPKRWARDYGYETVLFIKL